MRALALAFAGLLLSACNLQEASTVSPDFHLSVSPQGGTLTAGSSTILYLTAYPRHGFQGRVVLSYLGLPSGVTAAPHEMWVNGVTTVRLTLEAAPDAAPGTYTVTVRGTAEGVEREAVFALTVGVQGGGGGGYTSVTVTTAGAATVYYSTDGITYKPMDLVGGRASFAATGDYTVVARCRSLPEVYLVRASPARLSRVEVPCASPAAPRSEDFTALGRTPAALGGVELADGDLVFLGRNPGVLAERSFSVSSPIPAGTSVLVLTLARPAEEGEAPGGIAPLGYATVSRSPGQTSAVLEEEAWTPFVRLARVSPPQNLFPGARGSSTVLFLPEGGQGYGVVVGQDGDYGVLEVPGTYVGLAFSTADLGSGRAVAQVEARALGGNSWVPSFLSAPDPRVSAYDPLTGVVSVSAVEGATAYFLRGPLLTDATTGESLRLTAFFTSPPLAYALPALPELGYDLNPSPEWRELGAGSGLTLAWLAEKEELVPNPSFRLSYVREPSL